MGSLLVACSDTQPVFTGENAVDLLEVDELAGRFVHGLLALRALVRVAQGSEESLRIADGLGREVFFDDGVQHWRTVGKRADHGVLSVAEDRLQRVGLGPMPVAPDVVPLFVAHPMWLV